MEDLAISGQTGTTGRSQQNPAVSGDAFPDGPRRRWELKIRATIYIVDILVASPRYRVNAQPFCGISHIHLREIAGQTNRLPTR